MNELSLFTGAGGGLLGTKLLGWNCIGYVENDEYCQRVIAQRIKDGILDEAPIFTDVREFLQSGAAREYRGFADVVTGGFPCQDISAAGRGAGIGGKKSGLWKVMADIIREVRPRYAFVENSPILTSRGLDVVLGDLAEMGFDAEWGVLGASDVGAPHIRKRIWVVAYTNGDRRVCGGMVRDLDSSKRKQRNEVVRSSYRNGVEIFQANKKLLDQQISSPKPDGMVDGLPFQLEQLKAVGNGQVPRVAATAWRLLSD